MDFNNVPWDQVIAFSCGAIVMYALKEPKRTAKTIRGFLGGIGRGARRQNERYDPGGRRDRDDDRDDRDDDRGRRRDNDYDDKRDRRRRTRTRTETCSVCKGRGWLKPSGMDFSGQARRPCKQCDSTGEEVIEY